MSTRTNIIVIGKGFQIVLYRHHDGYPAVTGADLVNAIDRTKIESDNDCAGYGAAEFAQYLLAMPRGNGDKKPQFELTDDLHGDIEHVYQIHWPDGNGSRLTIQHAEPKDEKQIDGWRSIATRYTLEEFRAFVNDERAAMNARIVQYRKMRGQPADPTDALQPV